MLTGQYYLSNALVEVPSPQVRSLGYVKLTVKQAIVQPERPYSRHIRGLQEEMHIYVHRTLQQM